MRALIQRAKQGSVTINNELYSSSGLGLVILLGVGKGDTAVDVEYCVRKTVNLRIFEDENGKMNRSILDIGGEALVVSQFTLYADCRKGNRPGFDQAALPETAVLLYEAYLQGLRQQGIKVATGVFGADMQVELINDGPVTIMLESPIQNHG